MSRPRKLASCVPVLVFVALASSLSRAGDVEQEWAQKLQATYQLSKLNFLGTNVKETGCVLVLQMDGIVANPAEVTGDVIIPPATNSMQPDGQMKQGDVMRLSKTFKAGDRFYVYDIKFVGKALVFKTISVDLLPYTLGATTVQSRYAAWIQWGFNKESLKTATIEGFKSIFDKVFKLESDVNNAPPKTVSLGQSPEEVEQILGKPRTISNLGPKVIYVYADIKVVFIDGKVSDVQ